jgi:hypothetical protein
MRSPGISILGYSGRSGNSLECTDMAKKQEVVDDLLDALVWMRRKAKKHEPVDDLIDALVRMRRKVKKKAVKRKSSRKKSAKPKNPIRQKKGAKRSKLKR